MNKAKYGKMVCYIYIYMYINILYINRATGIGYNKHSWFDDWPGLPIVLNLHYLFMVIFHAWFEYGRMIHIYL